MKLALALALFATLACKKSSEGDAPKAEFGAPIAAKVEGKGARPAFEVAFAVTKGRDPEPLLGPLVSALSQGIEGCPAFVAEGRAGATTALQFAVDKGKAKLAAYKDPSPGTQCLGGALEGKKLLDETFLPLEARAEIRFPEAATGSASASASGAAKP